MLRETRADKRKKIKERDRDRDRERQRQRERESQGNNEQTIDSILYLFQARH